MKGIIITVVAVIIVLIPCALLFRMADRNCRQTAARYESRTVILDAGHGGEDGGAVAPDGTNEKDINLQITDAIALYFDLFGVPYQMTRTEDTLIGDNSLPTVRERKVSDIHTRMDMVEKTDGALLLSIHQNYYVAEKYSGTQVFYAPDAPGSCELAETLQRTIIDSLQPENTRCVKPTEGTVYLLDKAKKTSVMVECGFLSNQQELQLLKNNAYQSKMAYFITKGICEYFNNHDRLTA